MKRIYGNGLPKSALHYNPLARKIMAIPERDGRSNSWVTVDGTS
jgi:hypothetical protein